MKEKFKSFLNNDQIFYGFTILTISVLSFLLGQESVKGIEVSNQKVQVIEPVILQNERVVKTNSSTPTTKSQDNTKTALVGSKNGSKYHLLTCPGAKQIKPENIVTFDSIQAAEAAGYSRAGNCPEL